MELKNNCQNIFPSEFNWKMFSNEKRPQTLEWKILKLGFATSMLLGGFVGGIASVPESTRRFEIYAPGHHFGLVRHRVRKMGIEEY